MNGVMEHVTRVNGILKVVGYALLKQEGDREYRFVLGFYDSKYFTHALLCLHNQTIYCKSGNFRSTLIFALFAQNFTNVKIKTRQYVSLVQRSMGVNSAP